MSLAASDCRADIAVAGSCGADWDPEEPASELPAPAHPASSRVNPMAAAIAVFLMKAPLIYPTRSESERPRSSILAAISPDSASPVVASKTPRS